MKYFFGSSEIHKRRDNLARNIQNAGIFSKKIPFRSILLAEFSEFLVEWKLPYIPFTDSSAALIYKA